MLLPLFCGLLWPHSNNSTSFLCCCPWYRAAGGVSPEWNRGRKSPPSTCWSHSTSSRCTGNTRAPLFTAVASFHDRPAVLCTPQLMGLEKGRHPKQPSTKTGSGMCQASERCIQSVQPSSGLFSQKSFLRSSCCSGTSKSLWILLGRAGRQRQAPPTQEGCWSPSYPV